VDVTETIDVQLTAARCHASQVADFTAFETRIRNRAATLGKERGYRYAEGFDRVALPG
jgi:LmbE family N-acetylglucosaminyl deacetylase